jgi:hypothetical protein
MARITIDQFSGCDIGPIFVAGSVKEAEAVEQLLTEQSVDYAIAIEPFYQPGLFFVSQFQGATFYVPTGIAPYCENLLSEKGFRVNRLDKGE